MKDKIFDDLARIMDEIFETTQNFGDAFKEKFGQGHGPIFKWDENVDYYPAHSYPPANVYMTADKDLVFEFALAGFDPNSLDLQFKGDYLVLSASVAEDANKEVDVRYFKRRLKFKDVNDQKYFAPADKFDREAVKATFKHGVLRVTIPGRETVEAQEGVKINIEKEDA
jgi:molecular chaperone IbpB/HSP20 family protein